MSSDEQAVHAHSGATRERIAVVLLVVFLWGCGGGYVPKTGRIKIKPHDDIARNGAYCKYKIVTPIPDGSPLKENDTICIVCAADKTGCDDYTEVEENDGRVYNVQELTKGLACESCPKGTDSPPGFPREEAK